MATITVEQALSYAAGAGFTGNSQRIIVAIAQAESSLNTHAINVNADAQHSVDRGILQINNFWHKEVTDACAFDPACAFKQGYRISNGGRDFGAWNTYTSGAYLPFYAQLGGAKIDQQSGSGANSKPWYSYPFGNLFGQGDPGIGGEHGTDIETPPDTPITFLLSGRITDISSPDWGKQVTWKLDTPYKGIPYAYQIHLDAVNPDLRVGMHVNAGDLMGWSGGENSLNQLNGATNPTGQHFVDSAYMSGGPHTEFGFSYGPVYGSGAGFANIASHPELNPLDFLNEVRSGQIPVGFNGGSDMQDYLGSSGLAETGASSQPAVLNKFNDTFFAFSSAAHQVASSVPGFYGMCEAIDEAEQFPGVYNAFAGDNNPLDAPGNAVMTVLHTIGGNITPFLVRALIVFFGVMLLVALAWKAIEPVAENVLPVAGAIASAAA